MSLLGGLQLPIFQEPSLEEYVIPPPHPSTPPEAGGGPCGVKRDRIAGKERGKGVVGVYSLPAQ